MDHDFGPVIDLSQRCRACGKKFSFTFFLSANQIPECPGVTKGRVVVGKNVRLSIDGKTVGVFDTVEYSGKHYSGVYVVGETRNCECGAAKIGAQNYKPGHSDWCPVKETR